MSTEFRHTRKRASLRQTFVVFVFTLALALLLFFQGRFYVYGQLKDQTYFVADRLQNLKRSIAERTEGLALSLSRIQSSDDLALRSLFESTLMQHPDMFQLRIIDLNGKEIIKLLQTEVGNAVLVPSVDLQDKSKRPYFIDGIALDEGQYLLSQIELNEEFGKVEEPWEPVVRAVAKIRLADDKIFLLVLNVAVDRALDFYSHKDSVSLSYVLSHQGVYIIHPDTERRFANQLNPNFELDKDEEAFFDTIKERRFFIHSGTFWLSETVNFSEDYEKGTEYYIVSHADGMPVRWFVVSSLILVILSSLAAYFIFNRSESRARVVEELKSQHKRFAERERRQLKKQADTLNKLEQVANIGTWDVDLRSNKLVWSDQTKVIHQVPLDYEPDIAKGIEFYKEGESRDAIQDAVKTAMETGAGWSMELQLVTAKGNEIWVLAQGEAELVDGQCVRLFGVFQDITESYRLRESIKENNRLLNVTLQSIGDAVVTTDSEANVTWLNPVAERMTGWLNAEAYGQPIVTVLNIVDEKTREEVINPVHSCLQTGMAHNLVEQAILISRYGQEFGIADSAALIKDDDDKIYGAIMVFHDVTEQRRMTGEINYRARHDALTGLLNRTEFEHRLETIFMQSFENKTVSALLFIDLDQFKIVNDTCGHSAGDELLQQISKILLKNVRESDALARLGGDEFGIVLNHCDIERAMGIANKVCKDVDQYRFVKEEKQFRIGTSIGLVPVDTRWNSISELMQAADTACYAAKDAGRNRVHCWSDNDESIQQRHQEMHWATRIEDALSQNRFSLMAQKIVGLSNQTGLCLEVLIRLNENDEVIPPGAFLPVAERYHLATRIDEHVLLKTIEVIKSAPRIERLNLVHVNLSGQSVGDRKFHDFAIAALIEAGESVCNRLCFEITETSAIRVIADAHQFTERLRELGVKVALDDFGAGASSFGYLKSLELDILKIDGQFIRDLLDDKLDELAVRAFVEVAKLRNLHTVAEYVDNEAVYRRVQELGIDYAQGFLLHRPEPIETVLNAEDDDATTSGDFSFVI